MRLSELFKFRQKPIKYSNRHTVPERGKAASSVPPISQQYETVPPAKTHEQKVARDLRHISNTIKMMKDEGSYAVFNQEYMSLDIDKLCELLNASGIRADITSVYGDNTVQYKALTIRNNKKEESL